VYNELSFYSHKITIIAIEGIVFAIEIYPSPDEKAI
jgi:hypothetical protein